jgi:glycosyltransferase involved in cell wall biosynthesis
MATINEGVLILSPFFSPNIGGTENQLDDVVQELDKRGYPVFVQTYSPLTTKAKWASYEKRGKNIQIWRYHWFGYDLFHKVEKLPLVDFFYLTPYLFIRTFIWFCFNSSKIATIHAQGLNASLIGVILKLIFHKKLVTSIHAVYELNPSSIVAKINGKILNYSDKILATSNRSLTELVSFGVNSTKLDVFIPWIDLDIFKPLDKLKCRQYFKLDNKFTVIFLSRLIPKKGDRVLIKVAKQLPNINFVFAGVGPESDYIQSQSDKHKNIKFIGKLNYIDLPKYYNCADIYCFPTQYEEGFGKVLAESLACGIPIVTSNMGAIPKVVDSSVAILVKPTVSNIKSSILKLFQNSKLLSELKNNTVSFSHSRYSPENINLISRYY